MQKDITNTKSFDTVTQVGGSGNETVFSELKTMQDVTVYQVKTVAELNGVSAKADANVTVSQGAVVNEVEISKNASGTDIENVVSNALNVSIENNGTVGNVSGTNKPTVDVNPVKPPSTGGNSSEDNTQKPEEKLFDVDASYTKSTISIGITPSKDMNIGLLENDNIKISYLDESGNAIKTKDKTWSGYLNDEQGTKYGNGAEKPGTYSNELKAGVKYSTSVNAPSVGSNVLDRFEEVAQVKVIVKVGDLTQEVILDNNAK